jgi:type IV pilus assembly protein PilM
MSVGLDIGSKTIKVVEIVKDGAKYRLRAAGAVGYVGTQVEALVEDKDFAAMAVAIKKLFHDAKISSRDVSIALSEALVFTRTLRFPLLTDQEVASAVKWEAEEYVPIPLAEAIVQHQIIERRETGNPPQVVVLLVAVPRTLVEKYLKVVGLAGLNCVSIETELISLVRSLAPPDQTVIIVDFGAKSTDLAITKNEQLVFSRSIQTAGEAFTRAVAQYLGVANTQAEEYKRTYGLSPEQLEGKVGNALEPVFRVVAEEIKKVIHYYQIEEKGQAPTSLVLSGGTAGLPGLAPMLTKMLGIEVLMGNPFAKINVDADSARNLASYAPLYSIAVGLALRGE